MECAGKALTELSAPSIPGHAGARRKADAVESICMKFMDSLRVRFVIPVEF